MRNWIRAIGLACCIVAPTALASAWVDFFDGPQQVYRVDRAGQLLPLRVFMPLLPGDKINVLRRDYSVVVGYADGRRIRVDSGASPYVVLDAKIPDDLDNLLFWTRALIDDFRGTTDISRVNLTSRNRAPSAVLIDPSIQSVTGTRTTLPVTGPPPGSIRLDNRKLAVTAVSGAIGLLLIRVAAVQW